MPNHCHNRVTFYSDDTTAILKLHKIWSSGLENDDNSETCKTVFGNFIPEPNWEEIPLTEETVLKRDRDRRQHRTERHSVWFIHSRT